MTRTEFNMHCSVLSAAVVAMSEHVTKFSHVIPVPRPEAPESMEQLVKAWREALDSTGEYPVFSGGCEDTIYTSPEVNHAFRFWHDWLHFRTGYGFTTQGEERVGLSQVHHLSDVLGIGTGPVRNLLYADVVGQVYYFDRHKRFPENQREFIFDYVNARYADGSMDKVLACLY